MKNLTEGDIRKNLILLSWPTMIAMIVQVGFNLIDTFFVGKLGPEAIAAVSVVFPVVFLMFAIGGGLGIGTTSIISRYLGARKIKEADNAAEHSFLISLLVAVFFTISGLAFADNIFLLMGVTPEILALASSYSRWIFGFSIFMFISLTAISVLRGTGDMKTPMIGMLTALIINAVLDPLLIFGVWVFPELGIDGAALATVISRFFAAVLMVYFVLSSRTEISIKPKHFRLKLNILKEILRVGIPTSINQSLMSISLMVFTKIISVFGSLAIAAFGIGFKLEGLVILPVLAISTTSITIVGHNVGAKKFERAEETVWRAAKMSVLIVSLIVVLFLLFPENIFRIFSKDPQVIAYGVEFIRIMSISYLLVAVGINIGAGFQGSGHAMPNLIMTAVRLFILGIPLALLFSFVLGFGITGVWLGILSSSIIATIISIIWFNLGTWKELRNI